jgi:CubicO group peptidase (beta-lactamase class C family)
MQDAAENRGNPLAMKSRVGFRAAVSAVVLLGPAAAGAGQPPSERSAVVIPAGQIDRAVGRLDGLARGLLRKTGVPGMAIAVVHGDRVIYLRGFGVRRAGTQLRVDARTVFELASVSKPVGAAVIAGAVGRGCVHWTDPVATYIPGFALADPYAGNNVTIADMYAHRSGLPDHAGDLLEDLGFSRGAIIRKLVLEPLEPFRISYAYTNFGLTAGAEAAANACGKPWDQLSRDILYKPLGMTSTSSRFADYEHAPNHADLHARVGTAWVPRYVRNADAQSPAGGVSSSVTDMARFMRMELANGRFGGRAVIDEKALLETRNPNLMISPLPTPNSRATFYGLGMNVSYDAAGRLRLSHSGAFSLGAATTLVMLPSERLGIIVLTNAAPIGLPESVAADFMDVAEYGAPTLDWFAAYGPLFKQLGANPSVLAGKSRPKQPVAPRADDAYVGTYANRYYGSLTVDTKNGRLSVTLGPKHTRYRLAPWSGSVFSYTPSGENAVGISAATFTLDGSGERAKALTLESLNEDRWGTFAREGD